MTRIGIRLASATPVLAAILLVVACGGGGGTDERADPAVAYTCAPAPAGGYAHAAEPIGTVRQIYDGALTADLAVTTYRNIDRLFPTRAVPAGGSPSPLARATEPLTNVWFTAAGNVYGLQDLLTRNRVTGLLILKNGVVVNETCRNGNHAGTRWMSMSVAKSITSVLIGAALKDGHIASLDDRVVAYVPRLAGSAYDGATVRDVLTMSSGVRWNETYTDPASDRRKLLEAQISQVPGSAMSLMASLPRAAAPGTAYNYSTGETQVVGELLYRATGKPLAQYLSEKVWSRVGMEAAASWWLDSPDGIEIGGSGISATLRDYGRFGLFVMNDGVIGGEAVLPAGWITASGSPKLLTGAAAPINYGYLWWIPGGTSGADGAFYATGILGQYLYVNRKEKVVIVVWSAQTDPGGSAALLPMTPFFDAVVQALK